MNIWTRNVHSQQCFALFVYEESYVYKVNTVTATWRLKHLLENVIYPQPSDKNGHLSRNESTDVSGLDLYL